jgi:polysaccharide pyruvyl transferase WcaK-like protein
MKIGLVGYFGWGNYGDELFLQVHREIFSDHDLIIFHNPISNEFLADADELIASVDAIIIGGGDLLMPWGLSWLYFDKRFLAKPVFVFGIGVPSQNNSSSPDILGHYREFLSHPNVKLLSCRDVESASWIRAHVQPDKEIFVYPDMVLSLAFPPQVENANDVGLILRSQPIHDSKELIRIAALTSEYGHALKVILLGTEGITLKEDRAALAQLDLPNCNIVVRTSTDLLSQEIASCRYLLSMRFHGMVAAYKSGVPFISINLESKFTSFMKQTGNNRYASYWGDENLTEIFEKLLNEGADFSNRSALTQAAINGITILTESIFSVE